MRTRLLHVGRAARPRLALLLGALCAMGVAGCGGGNSTTTGAQTVNLVNGSNGLGGSTINPAGDGSSGFTGHAYLIPNSTTATTTTPISGATIVAQLGDGTILGKATTDGSGKYTIPLVAGTFLLTAQSVSATEVTVAPAQTHTIASGKYTTVDFSYINQGQ